MYRDAKDNLIMLRGDTEILPVRLKEKNQLASFQPGDVVYMSIRERGNPMTVLMTKEVTTFDGDGRAIILIQTSDTSHILPGVYMYDIRVKRNGALRTLFPKLPDKQVTITIVMEATTL